MSVRPISCPKPSDKPNRQRSGRAESGFTLLELLIAVAIFALIGLAGYKLLNSVIQTYQVTRDRGEVFSALQQAVQTLEQDLQQLSQRPVRDELGDPVPAFAVGYRGGLPLEFTRSAGWSMQDPAQQGESVTGVSDDRAGSGAVKQRIAYRLENNQLQRLIWPVLDRAPDTQPRVQVLLERVSHFEVRLLDSAGQWQSFWPLEDQQGQIDFRSLPRGIDVRFSHEQLGTVRRLFAREGL